MSETKPKTDEEFSTNEEPSSLTETDFKPLSFTQQLFDSIYDAIESVAVMAIETKDSVSQFMQIVTSLDERIEKLEKQYKENKQ